MKTCTDCSTIYRDRAILCPLHAAAQDMRALLQRSLRKFFHEPTCARVKGRIDTPCDCWASEARALLQSPGVKP